ncbi:MAG: hypothetical protein LUH02_04840 [Erysipelotrichaceae bacterium]|nr:hypothetical protein [Erysipelotrichaceae bacterium]
MAKRKKQNKKKKSFLKIFLIILAIVLVLSGIVFSLAYFDIVDIPVISDIFNKEETIEQDEEEDDIALEDLEDIDLAEEVLNSSEVLGTIKVTISSQTTMEQETVELFNARGFDASQVTSSYTIDGTYYSEEVIDETSTTYHPIYNLLYISDDDYYWYIYCIDGEFFAYPTSYILSHTDETETYVSESEYIISYDSYTNYFNRIIPNDSNIITVDEINAETLDELASKELMVS